MKTKLLVAAFCLIAHSLLPAAEEKKQSPMPPGVVTSELAARSLPPQIATMASVISPAPLVDLFRQIEGAEAALAVSAESLERAEKLFSSGELVAKKDLQAAQAQQAASKLVLQSLEDRLALEWGPHFSKLPSSGRVALRDTLLAGRQALLKLNVARGDAVASAPLAASLRRFGPEQKPLRCTTLFPAMMVDPAYQAAGFLGLLDTPGSPLPVGLVLTGDLEMAGEPRVGVFIPQDAVVFYLGKAWIYRKLEDGDFAREEISTSTPVEGGWFGTGDAKNVVTQGVQVLLSKETLAPAEE
jgi:hypothetical protein